MFKHHNSNRGRAGGRVSVPGAFGSGPVANGAVHVSSLISGPGFRACLFVGVCLLLAGCGDRIRQPSPQELARFRAADEGGPTVDVGRVLQARIVPGPYRAVAGDVLRVEMPRFPDPQAAAPGPEANQVQNCRIAEDGTIVLPIVGALRVQDKSLAQIEAAIAAQYYPKYVASPLPVYVSVLEYQTQRVSIMGAVAQPGVHALRHDQMSLVALLMQAGGIAGQGAAVIRINRAEAPDADRRTPIRVLPSDAGPRGSDPALAQRLQGSSGVERLRDSLRPTSDGDRATRNDPVRLPALRAVFEREGPLRTTGWLRVERDSGQVSVRKWLDIANGPQRRDFLGALATQAPWPGMAELDVRLARLGVYLENPPDDRGQRADDVLSSCVLDVASAAGRPSVLTAGWWRLDPSRFATAFYQQVDEPPVPNRSVAVLTPVEVTSAVGSARGSLARPTPRSSVRRPLRLPTRTPREEDKAVPSPSSTRDESSGWADRAGEGPSNPEPRVPQPTPGPRGDTAPAEPAIQTLVLPVRGLNIPFADVALQEGDTVVVEPPREQWVSVVGLVRTPGNMPYPPGTRINLIQAIAFANGMDPVADPRYVSVYRLAPDGEVVGATFQLVKPCSAPDLTDALALPLRPGDVVSVEHTPRTRTNVFFERVFRINLGLYLTPGELWNGN